MHIDSHFDSGNIDVVEILPGNRANLRIKKDAGDEHMQWFYFRVDGLRDQACTLRILNAGQASYPKAATFWGSIFNTLCFYFIIMVQFPVRGMPRRSRGDVIVLALAAALAAAPTVVQTADGCQSAASAGSGT